MARPKSGKYNIKDIAKIIIDYTNTTDLPILKEVCYQNNLSYDYIMELKRDPENIELTQSIKMLLYKKEVELEKGGLIGKYNNTMSIFSLKQLGWKDRQEEDILRDIENLSSLADLLGFGKHE